MFESKTGILFIAGVGFFVFAFLSNGALPMVMYQDLKEQTAEEVVNPRLVRQFRNLQERYPESFAAAFGELPAAKVAPPDASDAVRNATPAPTTKLTQRSCCANLAAVPITE